MGGVRRRAQRSRRARRHSCRYRHEPARPRRRSEGLALAGQDRKPADFEHCAPDEPFRRRRRSRGNPVNERADRSIRGRARRRFPAFRHRSPIHPASSWGGAPHYDLVRPGYALYGGNPTPDRDQSRWRRSSGWRDVSLQLRWVEAGETVGYNGRWTARGPRRLATVSVGYADGFPARGSAAAIAATSCCRRWRSWRAGAARSPAGSRWT